MIFGRKRRSFGVGRIVDRLLVQRAGLQPCERSRQTLGERTSKLGPFQPGEGAKLPLVHFRQGCLARQRDRHHHQLKARLNWRRRCSLVRIVDLAGEVCRRRLEFACNAMEVLRPVSLS